ncbi:hypothetical protein BUALT_Bualt05G0088000 [Buddleja alternifolia]|uniref:NAD(+) synthase [glutamine-hydrolyzing] n=1 Tax=Buddleja alternifolia TaxID=168488 RepID=A0AAV6XTK4_9LAMI|nr:hypothetical protein BUALT_Bualt05G0088000 [Buddleja alternifolia]
MAGESSTILSLSIPLFHWSGTGLFSLPTNIPDFLKKESLNSMNQWAMDFDCNMKNIKESISKAKEAGAVIRLGPKIEITGYGCQDHFLKQDTITHVWECLKNLLVGDSQQKIPSRIIFFF